MTLTPANLIIIPHQTRTSKLELTRLWGLFLDCSIMLMIHMLRFQKQVEYFASLSMGRPAACTMFHFNPSIYDLRLFRQIQSSNFSEIIDPDKYIM